MTLESSSTVPLTSIDEMFIHLDDPSKPLTVQLEVRVAGRLEENRLRAAITTAAAQHPLARARLLPSRPADKQYTWTVDDELQIDPLSVIEAAARGELDDLRSDFYSRPVSLAESPPFRALLVRDGPGDLLMLSINHTACDGIGALRLMQSIGRAYAGVPDPGVDFDPAEALRRALPTAKPGMGERLDRARMSIRHVSQMRSRATVAPKDASPDPGNDVLTTSLAIGPLASSPLRRRLGATVNDVLLAALHRAVDQWNTQQGRPPDRITIPIPVNARPVAWQNEVLANLITSESVSTTAQQRETSEATLAAVAGWMTAAKERGTGSALAAQTRSQGGRVGLRQSLGGVMKAVAGFLAGTAALSNLGLVPPDWIEGEDFEVREIWVSPPTVQTALAVGAVTVRDTLFLSLRSDRAVLSRGAVSEIADLLRVELDEIATSV